jgi:hypothetical protein
VYVGIAQIGIYKLSEEEKLKFVADTNKELAKKGTELKPVRQDQIHTNGFWEITGDAAATVVMLQTVGVNVTLRDLYNLANEWLREHNKDTSQMKQVEKMLEFHEKALTQKAETDPDNPVIALSKIDAARREINAAIRMYFADEDPVAIHAVMAGGMQIVSDLGQKQGMALGFEMGMEYIRKEKRKDMRNLMRALQNHIKHAQKPGDEIVIYEFRPAVLEMDLLLAGQSYFTLTKVNTPEIGMMNVWIALRYPEILTPDAMTLFSMDDYIKKFGKPSDKDKKVFGEHIKNIRSTKLLSNLDYS